VELRPWLIARTELPVGPLFCIIDDRIEGESSCKAAERAAVLMAVPSGRLRA
jgi:hypothetical protein